MEASLADSQLQLMFMHGRGTTGGTNKSVEPNKFQIVTLLARRCEPKTTAAAPLT